MYRANLKHVFAIIAVDTTVDGSIRTGHFISTFEAALENIEESFVKKNTFKCCL